MAGITPIFLVLFDSGPLQIGPIIFPLNNESDDNMMNTKNAPSSPLSHAPNSEYLFPDWNMGIPKDILDDTDADEKRVQEATLEVIKEHILEVIWSV